FSSRRRHTRFSRDWSSDVCSSDLTITSIKELTGLSKIVRAMPNLPAKIGKGVTSFVASPQVSKIEKLTIESLLSTTGTSIQVSKIGRASCRERVEYTERVRRVMRR